MTPLKQRHFTLLEVMVTLALILIASGLTGWKMHQVVCKKRFQSDLQKLESRLWVCQRMAVAMQSDWKGTLKRQKGGWVFDAVCVDRPEAKPLRPLRINPLEVFFEGEKKEAVTLDFFASGHVLPDGEFLFCDRSDQKKELKIPQMFSAEGSSSSKNLPPVHPLSEPE